MNEPMYSSEAGDFEVAFEEKYVRVLSDASRKVLICELLADYIPIEDFKEVFSRIGEIVRTGEYKKFVFDKRSLRAFHQPTMEWYFIEWKRDMLGYGLKVYRKILPKEKWFEKMVYIAKDQIMQSYPDNVISQLDIKYCGSMEEALRL